MYIVILHNNVITLVSELEQNKKETGFSDKYIFFFLNFSI